MLSQVRIEGAVLIQRARNGFDGLQLAVRARHVEARLQVQVGRMAPSLSSWAPPSSSPSPSPLTLTPSPSPSPSAYPPTHLKVRGL